MNGGDVSKRVVRSFFGISVKNPPRILSSDGKGYIGQIELLKVNQLCIGAVGSPISFLFPPDHSVHLLRSLVHAQVPSTFHHGETRGPKPFLAGMAMPLQ